MRSPLRGAGCSGVREGVLRDAVERFRVVLERFVVPRRFVAMTGSVLRSVRCLYDSTLVSQTPCQ